MRVLVASDLHGSLSALRFLRDKAAQMNPDMLLLLGDLVYHGPRNPLPASYDTGAILRDMPALVDFPFPVTAVRGNCDAEVDVVQMPFPMPESAWIDADGLQIFACHGHHLPANPPIPELPRNTVIMRGHTHVPRAETIEGLTFLNPGSLSLPKEGFPPSYGIFENGLFRVLDLADNEILRLKIVKTWEV